MAERACNQAGLEVLRSGIEGGVRRGRWVSTLLLLLAWAAAAWAVVHTIHW